MKILETLQFDFQVTGPCQCIERFLRILNYDKTSRKIIQMAYQICKFSQNDSEFLDYRQSQLAACACIITINIYEKDKNNGNFKFEKLGDQIQLNTDIWNNSYIVGLTGYTIEILKVPLYRLCLFIRENLTPDRLAQINLEAIQNVKNFEPDSNNQKQLILQ